MDNTSTSTAAAVTETGTKRKRLSQACLVCRRKKTKCDGVKPVCNNCRRLNQECTYGPSNRKRGPRQKHIDILEQRLEKMERLLKPREPVQQNSVIPVQHQQLQQLQQLQQEGGKSMVSVSPAIGCAVYKYVSNDNIVKVEPNSSLPPIHVGHNLTTSRSQHQAIEMDRKLLPPDDIMDHIIKVYLERIYGVSPFFYRDDLTEKDSCPVVCLMAIAAATIKFVERPGISDQPLLWLTGDKYAEHIRQRINDIVDMPSVAHVQVMMLMLMHEFGCARGTRSWMYGGIAGRMTLELGLHKEPTHRVKDGDTMSVDTWKKNELRRNVFWGMYVFDRFGSASCARPVLFNDDDIDCHLPCNDDCLEHDTFYSESLDGTQLICYKVIERDDDRQPKKIKLVETTLQNPLARSRCNLGWPTHMIRITSLFAKVATFVNRTMAKLNAPLAPYDIPGNEYTDLSNALDQWYNQLPFSLRNTPANLQRYRSEETTDTHRFLLSHILYNSLIVFLNRPALTLISNIKNLDDLPKDKREAIQLGEEKCLAASDNVSIMLTDINTHAKRVFPFLAYLTYSTATVVVHTIFTGTPTEAKKAAAALKAHCEFLQNMRKYYAMADKFFFMLRDFYGLHKNQIMTREEEQDKKRQQRLVSNTVDDEEQSVTSSVPGDTSSSPTVSTDAEFANDTCGAGGSSYCGSGAGGGGGYVSSSSSIRSTNSNRTLDDLMGSIDTTFNQLFDQQMAAPSSTSVPLNYAHPNAQLSNPTVTDWSLYFNPQQVPGALPTTTSTELDYYSTWPFSNLHNNNNNNTNNNMN